MERNNQEFKKKLIADSFGFSKRVIQTIEHLPNKKGILIIINQLIRAATSIGANIIEAQAASSKKDFINFLTHALKSGNETKYWIALLKIMCPEKAQELDILMNNVVELSKILGSSIATLKGKKKL